MPLTVSATRRPWLLTGLGLALGLLAWWALGQGAMKLHWSVIADVFVSHFGGSEPGDAVADAVVWQIRFPRIISAALVGAGLALAGSLLQGLFRNPLADPGLIGVSSGAAMGAVIAIVLLPALGVGAGLRSVALPLAAMAGGVATTFLVYQLSRVGGRIHVASMLLTGIAVNAIGGALIGLAVTLVANDEQLRSVTFWSLGSIAGANWAGVAWLAAVLVPGLLLSLRLGRPLNAFLLGEIEAYHLGVNVARTKRLVIALAALMVGVSVAFTGIIGFLGLVAPHITRLSLGPDHRLLLPASALGGAILLLLADTAARVVVAPAELAIGILTALIGGPFFLFLLLQGRRQTTF